MLSLPAYLNQRVGDSLLNRFPVIQDVDKLDLISEEQYMIVGNFMFL